MPCIDESVVEWKHILIIGIWINFWNVSAMESLGSKFDALDTRQTVITSVIIVIVLDSLPAIQLIAFNLIVTHNNHFITDDLINSCN